MSIKVLLVDDSATVRKLLAMPLLEEGFEVLEAADGLKGVERIQVGDVDFVICDFNLPSKNGIELIEDVKQEPRFESLPIVILSNQMSDDLVGEAKSAGASGWIRKPCDPTMLVAVVKSMLEQRQSV